MLLIHPAQGQAVGAATQVRHSGAERRSSDEEEEGMWRVDTYRLSPKFMGSRKPLRPSSFPRRIWRNTEEEVRRRRS